ncbi:hypothetical protein OEZ86_006940 [Tetradesmus obliquus]|nr:hypothetical protein OEZ86_006940 [Tetradesmus obliquus]
MASQSGRQQASSRAVLALSEFETAAANVRDRLEAYKAKTKQHLDAGRAKPDMIAYKELRVDFPPREVHGHIPGVTVGQAFLGRGELAILGLHTQMMRGIMSRKGEPAFAIVMSGGYKDDADTGGTFWYTGQGGQGKNNTQIKDQEYTTPDNAALVQSVSSHAPVRVFRGKVGEAGERLYVYEGLYLVAAHKREPSKDGPQVIKFQMVGVPGHHAVSSTVDFKCLHGAHYQTVLLARAGGGAKPGRKRGRAGEPRLASAGEVAAAIQQRAASGSHGRLVTADVSQGQEKLPIPVWNAVDDDDSILQPMAPPGGSAAAGGAAAAAAGEEDGPEFEYTRDYKFGEEEAKQLAIAAEQAFAASFPGSCGLQYTGKAASSEGNYNEAGLMLATQPCGIMECDEGCACSSHCKFNRVVSDGIRYPLEVFKVSRKVGWGVRCTEDLPIGAFVCCYVGLVITDEWADRLRSEDLYLFDLNHFHLLWDADAAGEMPDVAMNPRLHALQGELRGKHLVIDAARQGNVGRFLNHSCSPNCLVQTVFAGNARSQLLYYICIVAQQDIPAFTQLTYNYGWTQSSREQAGDKGDDGVPIRCQCGSAQCRNRLI